MNRLLPMIALVLPFHLGISACAAEPKQQTELARYKAFALRVQKLVRENKREELANCFDDKLFYETRVPQFAVAGLCAGKS